MFLFYYTVIEVCVCVFMCRKYDACVRAVEQCKRVYTFNLVDVCKCCHLLIFANFRTAFQDTLYVANLYRAYVGEWV